MVTRVQPVCDRSGIDIPADEYAGPTRFSWIGDDYEVDLCASEAEAFVVALDDHAAAIKRVEQFVAVSRQISPPSPVQFVNSTTSNVVGAAGVFVPVASGGGGSFGGASVPAAVPGLKPKRARKATAAKKASQRQPAKSSATGRAGVYVGGIPDAEVTLPAEPESATNGNGKVDGSVVRAWALSEGLTVPSRGRLPKAVTLAYEAAMDA